MNADRTLLLLLDIEHYLTNLVERDFTRVDFDDANRPWAQEEGVELLKRVREALGY